MAPGPDALPRLAEGDALLIAAQSGRALAAAARRAGFRPFVADLFGDEDTRDLAEAWRRLPGRFGARPQKRAVLAALDELAAEAGGRPFGLVLGSGFEASPGLIAELAGRFRLLGAEASVVARLKEPLGFAALLAELGVPHPPVTLDPVPDPQHWVSKRRGGSGGGHVRPASTGRVARWRYLQRRIAGRPVGVSALANGLDAQWIGATAQFTAARRTAPYRFAGALEPAVLPPRMRAEMEAAVRAIVAATGLKGLFSADCLVDGERWWLLEINPRPGGSLDVLDRRSTPLLLRHIDACLGRLSAPDPTPAACAGTRILYADERDLYVNPVTWPDGVMDRPPAGTRVGRGSPLCTLWAEGTDRDAVLAGLDRRETAVWNALRGRDDHGHGIHDDAGAPERERACSPPGR